MILLTLVSAALALGQDQTVTYSTVAKPLGAVLTEISEQTHQKYQVDELLVNQPIIVDVKGVSANDLLARIAKVSYGKWETKGDVQVLILSDDAVQDARKAWHDKLAKGYAAALAKKMQRVAKEGPFTLDTAHSYLDFTHNMMRKMSQSGANPANVTAADYTPPATLPNQRAVSAILAAIGADALANIGDGERVVYSTNPNTLQQGLDPNSPAITDYVQAEKVWNQVIGSMPKVQLNQQTLSDVGKNGMPDPDVMDTFMSSYLKGPDTIGKIDVAIKNEGGDLTATLDVFDAQGKLGDTTPDVLDTTGIDMTDPASMMQLMTQMGKTKTEEGDKYQIPLSTEAKAFQGGEPSGEMGAISPQALKAMRHMAGGFGSMMMDQNYKLPAGMRAQMLRPDVRDPLSWDVSELLNGLADHQSTSLVAMLPDSDMDLFQGIGTTASTVETAVNGDPDLGILRATGWIQISSLDPDSLLHHRTNRKDLARLLTSLDTSKSGQMDLLGAYYLTHPDYNDAVSARYVSACGLRPQAAMFGVPSEVTCALYAAIDETTRERLRAGEKLHVADLGMVFGHALADYVYSGGSLGFSPGALFDTGPNPNVEVQAGDSNPPDQAAPVMDPEQIMSSVRGMFSEPTENFPNGIPPDGVVEMTETTEVGAKSADPGADDEVLTAESIAYAKQPKTAEDAGEDQTPLPKTFRLVHSVTVNFKIKLGKQTAAFSYTDSVPVNGQVYSWGNAPQDFKDAIKKASDEMSGVTETKTPASGP